MAAPQASSRLELLQARFQQKQLQEKEQKLLQLYDQQQQRAYQVVQRGSAGSNGSNHGSSISQHSVTRTSTSSHTTSTSQGGKVRQMFDERRHTTVKGIDRSYPLEPLENKPRKQANGNGVQKNGNLTVNRQSVTVKRVSRADVNSNLNGGKPVVSYHEEITRESFGPSGRHHEDDDEFGNENHIAQYANGKHRDQTQIEEVLDEDTIERNRMMAKLHLMQYDETLKHRVKNDLESEEFPEDFMVDVPDKLPKQTVARKVSQAEARLERFKNANARRNNSIAKNTITVPKKRSDPSFPAKSTSRKSEIVETRTLEVLNKGSGTGKKSPRSRKTIGSPKTPDNMEETLVSTDSERNRKRKSDSAEFFCKQSEKSATTYAIDARAAGKMSPEFSKARMTRSESPKYFCNESEKSATTYAIDPKAAGRLTPEFSKNRVKRSESPKYFCKESEKCATTYAVDSKTAGRLTPEFSKDRVKQSETPKYFCKESEKSATTYAIDSKTTKRLSPEFFRDKVKRSESPKFYSNESKKSASTFTSDSKREPNLLPISSKDVKRRSDSPKFFCKESEKSATTYAIDSKTAGRLTPEFSKDKVKRSLSPKYFCKESETSATTYAIDSKTAARLTPEFSKDRIKRSESPKFFCKESEKSATTYAIDSKMKSTSPDFMKSIKRTEKSKPSAVTFDVDTLDRNTKYPVPKDSRPSSPRSLQNGVIDRKEVGSKPGLKSIRNGSPNVFEQLRKTRNSSPRYTCCESKQPTSMHNGTKDTKFTAKSSKKIANKRSSRLKFEKSTVSTATSKSPDRGKKTLRKSSASPQFYTSDSERSASILFVTPETITKTQTKKDEQSSEFSVNESDVTIANEIIQPRKRTSVEDSVGSSKYRSSVSRFFSEQCEKTSRNVDTNAKKNVRSPVMGRSPNLSRGTSPVSLKDLRTPSPARRSPQLYRKEIEKPKATTTGKISSSRGSSPGPRKMVDSRTGTPEFFCYETERSATTMSLKPKPVTDSTNKRTKSPLPFQRKSTQESSESDSKNARPKNRPSSKSPDNLTRSKDVQVTGRKGSVNVLRSTKLIRDIMNGQSNRNDDCNSEKGVKELRRTSVASENVDGISSVGGVTSRHQSKKDETVELEANRKVDKRATTPIRTCELLTPESSPKSSASVEVDVEVQEITMHDQYIKQEKLQSTYSKSSGKTVQGSGKSKTKDLFTYSVRKPARKRGSLFESNIFESMKASKTEKEGRRGGVHLKHARQTPSTVERSYSSSPSPTILKRGTRDLVLDRKTVDKKGTLGRRRLTPSPIRSKGKETGKANLKESTLDDSRKQQKTSSQAESLRSMELVRKAMERPNFNQEGTSRGTLGESIGSDEVVGKHETPRSSKEKIERRKSSSASTTAVMESKSTFATATNEQSSSKDYERTQSVESALRRFDSIGTASVQSITALSRESMTEKGQSIDFSSRTDASRTISLKALDQENVNFRQSPTSEPLKTSATNASTRSFVVEASCKAKTSGAREQRRQKRFAKARDSIEMARIAMRSESPACKRKLFREADSDEETETGSSKSKCSLDSVRTVESLSSRRRFESTKNDVPDTVRGASRSLEPTSGGGTSTERADKGKADKTSTGASDSDDSLAVKQLRSIEDIRKSIDTESATFKSAIAKNASRHSGTVRSGNIGERIECRKKMSLPKRKENLSTGYDCLEGSKRSSVKCATRFSRVAKSPSPDSTKIVEPSSRTRRYIPPSPSKSPDTVARRPSTELKAQETKSTKRPVPMKGAEPIGNRKTTTSSTSTATRKSTDVVDGAILENGLHLRDQTAETKYDNDSPTTKKSDAFIIDFDEQPPKENDAPVPRKPLLRKQSIEKQIPSALSARPPSSVSSISSGSSMQGQTSVSRGKMASKAKTPISGTISSRGSASSKGGGNACTADNLVSCKICERRFAQDRISLHEQICAKTGQKKRKQFDAMVYRVRGTDLEPFVKKGMNKKQNEKTKKPEIKTNWRRKHEDFINAIRSAKQVQAYLAAGGKLSDLPPPPASDTSDYIQCPHCGRKFNQAAAERHIPKCEHMLHNKPTHSRPPKPRR